MTAIDVLNQYPSTDDLPPIMGAQDDPVLAIIQGARRRYKANGTEDSYMESNPDSKRVFVCALGSFGAAVGIKSSYDEDCNFPKLLERACKVDESAKLAIKLVNDAARKLYPESKNWRSKSWSAPIEWINQEYGIESGSDRYSVDRFKKAKKAVLACYDYAIEQRAAGIW